MLALFLRLILQPRLTLCSNPFLMKRLFLAAALFLVSLCFGEKLSAGNFGISGGASFYTSKFSEVGKKTLTQWNAGIVYKCNLPLGFQVHPALVYNVKPSTDAGVADFSLGCLEFVPSIQWGVDLILFRPYVEVSPFVGYGLNANGDFSSLLKTPNMLEYGVGLGGGLQVWHFQVAARYNWCFTENKSLDFNGVTLTLTYFFGNR